MPPLSWRRLSQVPLTARVWPLVGAKVSFAKRSLVFCDRLPEGIVSQPTDSSEAPLLGGAEVVREEIPEAILEERAADVGVVLAEAGLGETGGGKLVLPLRPERVGAEEGPRLPLEGVAAALRDDVDHAAQHLPVFRGEAVGNDLHLVPGVIVHPDAGVVQFDPLVERPSTSQLLPASPSPRKLGSPVSVPVSVFVRTPVTPGVKPTTSAMVRAWVGIRERLHPPSR